MSPLAQYAVKQEILDLLYLRARSADRFDITLMRACHPLDGTDNHGTFQGRMHGFIDMLEQQMATGPACLSKEHVIANALFEFLPNGDVFCESYHVAHETFVRGDGTEFYHIGGRYLDLFRLVEGRWLIQHRDIVYDWMRILPRAGSAMPEGALRGTRTPADPLYSHVSRGTLPGPGDMPGDVMTDLIQRLLDKQEISEMLYRRARAGDRADVALAHSCYHPGATERHGMFDGPAAEFIDVVSFTAPKPDSPVRGMLHLITNILCSFRSDAEAFVESYHVAWPQMTDGNDATVGGRYHDRFEKRDGRWAIAHRDVIFDWSRVEPETEKFWTRHPAKAFLFGKRGAEDPLYHYVARGS